MLPKKYRVTKNKEYENIFKNGVSVFSGFIILRAVRNDLGFDRFGFIASLKVSKKAYQRVKIKRWLRESARTILQECSPNGGKDGFDIAVIAKKGAFETSFKEMNSELKWAFSKMLQIYERKKSFDKNNQNISKNNFSGP